MTDYDDRIRGIAHLLKNRFGLELRRFGDPLYASSVGSIDGYLDLHLDLAKAEELVYALGFLVPGDTVPQGGLCLECGWDHNHDRRVICRVCKNPLARVPKEKTDG
jgi:hypothetical protein